MVEYLTASDAIQRIRTATALGHRCLGADGVELVPEGIMSRLDLILDASSEPLELQAAAALTISFILENAADEIVWDVVISDDFDMPASDSTAQR